MGTTSESTARAGHFDAWTARDATANGRFVAGVLTTGIYCLPACPARRPKPENVRFFDDEDAARAAGLRPCKRCRPDRFYRGYDPDEELAARLVTAVLAEPAAYVRTTALAARAGVGATKLTALFRAQLHTTPRAFVHAARVRAAARDLLAGRRLVDAALDQGFESSSAFHAGCLEHLATTPAAYARLGRRSSFELALPADHHGHGTLRLFERDPDGRTERLCGRVAHKAVLLGGRPAVLVLEQRGRRVRVRVEGLARPGRARLVEAHGIALRLLGLGADPGPFERWARRTKDMGRLVRGREGLRLPRTANAFEGLVWVVVGQQVNLAFAAACRAALVELAGERVGDMVAHPSPAAVAALDHGDLVARRFSRRKAEYLVDAARLVARGELPLEALGDGPVGRAGRTLGAVRGLGPWSVHYLLMRSYGFADCVPAGDVALAQALANFFGLEARPDARGTVRWMERFAPHRSLATAHLWRSLSDA